MAFHIIYKPIFEVLLLSDYFLTDADAFHTISTGENTQEQISALIQQGYNISNYFSIEPTEECKRILRGQHMVFTTTAFGFLVGLKVKIRMDGLAPVYEPAIPIRPGLRLSFHLRLKDPNFVNFSNIRVRPGVPANFYFSNVDPGGELSFPYLSLPPVEYATGRRYEMGEWVQAGGQIYQANINASSGVTPPTNPGWETFNASASYVTYRDQKLLPQRFPYSFSNDPDNLIMSADFELIGSTVTGGGLISVGGTGEGEGPFSSVPLDFRRESPGLYTLEVSDGGSYTEQKEIILDDERYNHRDFALIEIGHENGLGDFRLLESGGELQRMEAGELAHPIFQIAFRNRATYWQYFLHEEEDFDSITDTNFDIEETEGYIVSKQPRLLTATGSRFTLNVDSGDISLPSPTDLMIKPRTDKIFSESYYLHAQKIII